MRMLSHHEKAYGGPGGRLRLRSQLLLRPSLLLSRLNELRRQRRLHDFGKQSSFEQRSTRLGAIKNNQEYQKESKVKEKRVGPRGCAKGCAKDPSSGPSFISLGLGGGAAPLSAR